MRYAFSVLLAAHGLAHLPGFLVSWRLMQSPDVPYKTTLLAGRMDVGDVGIRIVGLAWFATAVLMIIVATGMALKHRWAEALVLLPVITSLALCVLELPHARIGLVVNVVALLWLTAHPTLGAGSLRWAHGSADERGRLTSVAHAPVGQFTPLPEDLPASVRRYLDLALHDAAADTTRVELRQQGEFRMGDADDSWKPFTATEVFTVSPPGFVWDARIRMAPGIHALVRDSYIGGVGAMKASAQGVKTIVDATPSDALSQGALQRWFAEAVWFPMALRPERGVRWEAMDEQRARATIVDAGHTVSLEFTFSTTGDVVRVFAPDRMREVQGRYEPTPWEVVCTDHAVRDGVRIPTQCEVAWLLPTGRFPYWRGRIVE